MNFFTFCVFINRIEKQELEDALLVLSMKNIPNYHLSFINYNVNLKDLVILILILPIL